MLERGFVAVKDEKGYTVTKADQATPGAHLSLLFAKDQEARVTVGWQRTAWENQALKILGRKPVLVMTTTATVILLDLAPVDPNAPLAGMASAINSHGIVVGETYAPDSQLPVMWSNGVASALALLPGDIYGLAEGINDLGQAVGWTSSSIATGVQAVLWTDGKPLALTGPDYTSTEASAINNKGEVVGEINDYPNASGVYAFSWQNGVMTALPVLTFQTGPVNPIYASYATAINDNGQIVGWAENNNAPHATLWQNGTVTDLGLWNARSINNGGTIVGDSTTTGYQIAYEWRNGTLTALADLPFYGYGGANSINDAGVVAGSCTDDAKAGSTAYQTAVIWVNGAVVDLNTLLPSNSPWHLEWAASINDQNMIVGEGLYNGIQAEFEMTLGNGPIGVTAAAAAQSPQSTLTIIDSAANVAAAFDQLQTLAKAGRISSIDLTDSTTPVLPLTAAQWIGDADALAAVTGTHHVDIVDSAANILSHLDSLNSGANDPYHKQIDAIVLNDAGFVTLNLTPGDLYDVAALAELSGNFIFEFDVPQSSAAYIALPTGHGSIVTFIGKASDYLISEHSGGALYIVPVGGGGTDYVANVTALKFADVTDIVAQTPGTNGQVTTGNVTELYSAVLARVPDVSGLAFYQNYLAANPTTPLVQFAEFFLNSSEYASAHSYAQTTAGETQFIIDSYQNLLHRTPSADEINFYLTNVLEKPGTQLQNHAQMLVYFSASPEFLGDVTVTTVHPSSTQHWLVLI